MSATGRSGCGRWRSTITGSARSGGYGVGYGAPASVGAALANRDLGRFSVTIQSDGDLMYAPGVLWTAAQHKIPLLAVMHNNRGYHQEVMHVQRLSNFRNRVANLGGDMGPIGTSIQNPDIEYHKLAESMGWWAKGPIKDPGPARARDQGSGGGGEVRPARAAQRLDAAALREVCFMRYFVLSGWRRLPPALCSAAARAFAASAEKGKTAYRPARLLGVPRLPGAGRRHRPEARARTHGGRSVHGVRARQQSRHAALPGGDPVERRPRRHLRLSAVDPQARRLQEHSAAQSVAPQRDWIGPASRWADF